MAATKLTKEEQKQKNLENQEANARTHSLVVKIISWRTRPLDSNPEGGPSKISKEEWETYKKHLQGIATTDSKDKVIQKIKEVYEAIKLRGGFQE